MTSRPFRHLALAAAGALFCLAGFAQTAVPATVKLIVGYAPGGPVDTAARQFAPHFGDLLVDRWLGLVWVGHHGDRGHHDLPQTEGWQGA